MSYQKLDPEFKSKWIAALRSGEYEQGKNSLFENDKFCCLGVAGVLCGIDKHKMKGSGVFTIDPEEGGKENFLGVENGIIPNSLIGSSSKNSIVSIITGMNDSGKSFEGIANWIEENL